jgi:hypothetical protein
MTTVILEIRGGVVTVDDLPEGVSLLVRDFDVSVDLCQDEKTTVDDFGDPYIEIIYEG